LNLIFTLFSNKTTLVANIIKHEYVSRGALSMTRNTVGNSRDIYAAAVLSTNILSRQGQVLLIVFLPLFNLHIRKTLQIFHLFFAHNYLLINNLNSF
jgi:hypothetical protein